MNSVFNKYLCIDLIEYLNFLNAIVFINLKSYS